MSDIEINGLTELRELADSLGIPYTARTSLDSLRKKIDAFNNPTEEDESLSVEDILQAETPVKTKSLNQHIQDEELALIRVRVVCLDPKKKELPGEIFTVTNSYLGTVKKYVPYGAEGDNGWHIPKCIYNAMKESTFLSVRMEKDKNTRRDVISAASVPQFSIEVLPPLTKTELADLAKAQAAAGE